jgi:hypothetical protein
LGGAVGIVSNHNAPTLYNAGVQQPRSHSIPITVSPNTSGSDPRTVAAAGGAINGQAQPAQYHFNELSAGNDSPYLGSSATASANPNAHVHANPVVTSYLQAQQAQRAQMAHAMGSQTLMPEYYRYNQQTTPIAEMPAPALFYK